MNAMGKTTHTVGLLLGLTLLANDTPAQPPVKLSELRSAYPWSTIFVSFKSLHELSLQFDDDKERQLIIKKYPGAKLLVTFLQKHRPAKIGLGVATLCIGLEPLRAGFKRVSDPTGTLQELPWGKKDTEDVARFCHQFLNTLREFDRRTREMLTTTSLGPAIRYLEECRKNPLLSKPRVFAAYETLAVNLATHQDRVKSLATSNPQTYRLGVRILEVYSENKGRLPQLREQMEKARAKRITAACTLGVLKPKQWELAATMGIIGETSAIAFVNEVIRHETEYVQLWEKVLNPFPVKRWR